MKTFRIDKRNFDIGDTIFPQNKYQNNLDDMKARVEIILEEKRPNNKPKRNDILMLFQNFEGAKHFWTILNQSKFYKTEILETEILHIGDYNKIEELYKNIQNVVKSNQIAEDYWNGVYTESPKPEIFVNDATVKEILSNSEKERKNAYAERAGCERNDIKIIKDEDENERI